MRLPCQPGPADGPTLAGRRDPAPGSTHRRRGAAATVPVGELLRLAFPIPSADLRTLNRKRIAALVGIAPIHQSGQWTHAGTPCRLGRTSASAHGPLHGPTGRQQIPPSDPRVPPTDARRRQSQEIGACRVHASRSWPSSIAWSKADSTRNPIPSCLDFEDGSFARFRLSESKILAPDRRTEVAADYVAGTSPLIGIRTPSRRLPNLRRHAVRHLLKGPLSPPKRRLSRPKTPHRQLIVWFGFSRRFRCPIQDSRARSPDRNTRRCRHFPVHRSLTGSNAIAPAPRTAANTLFDTSLKGLLRPPKSPVELAQNTPSRIGSLFSFRRAFAVPARIFAPDHRTEMEPLTDLPGTSPSTESATVAPSAKPPPTRYSTPSHKRR